MRHAAKTGILLAILGPILAACAGPARSPAGGGTGGVATDFQHLPGWDEDDLAAAMPAVWNTCSVYAGKPAGTRLNYNGIEGPVEDWRPICDAANRQTGRDRAQIRHFFESWFTPVALTGLDRGQYGRFTGYFAPELNGSRVRGGVFQTPLYRTPSRDRDRRHSRAEIARGALEGRGYEIVWVDDPIDAFFLEIQGSGKVRLTDGSVIGLKFDGQNGQRYKAVGRVLVDSGVATLDEMSMGYIRNWMLANPDRAQWLMNQNPSYVYFREKAAADVVGAHDVPLTAGRSLAVDNDYISLGTPVWLDIEDDPTVPNRTLRRLVLAQDIGGAIRGPIRGDLYWGEGHDAGALASAMNAEGRAYLLVPRATLGLPPAQ
ncbi:membrane-bound lytic murein transglycosylase A [Inquilinus ginsengisoli]|uniref:peptidoglycan lytic exotransglycosylase n=1 Tax=Inquilinus ginsengisoli TaxID=363840 RepID=A0ABU1JVD2_9PROT|nr:MltA domain-containing protein [Inquilinus ginsengisoli]MDR6292580.1 membrane-bound lytic murein transglycosylase A [Inquilinus ginsengisoli]